MNCNDGAGPERGRAASLSVVPGFESALAGIVPLAAAWVTLTRADGDVALDTVVDIETGADSLELNLQVIVFSDAETFQLTLAFINPAGDTVFRAGPVEVTATVGGGPAEPTPLPLTVTYVGTGANAASVVITSQGLAGIEGDALTLAAVARDSSGADIPGTPIAWRSIDPNRATFADPAVGTMVAGGERGPARIEAMLITGPADTGSVDVQPRPTTLAIVGGDGQSDTVGRTLAGALVARVTAADAQPVTGIEVTFSPGAGSVSNPSVFSDPTGQVQSQWTLGTVAGAQGVTARVTRFPTVSNTFGATAAPGAVAVVVVSPASASLSSVGATQQFTATANDAFANVVPGQTFDWTSLNTGVATVGATTGLATAVANGSATIQAAVGPIVGTAALTVGQAATQLAFTTQPGNAVAGGTIAPAVQVTARDANSNPVATFTGNVSIAIGTNPASGTLAGTTTVAAVGGVATFGDLGINNAGTGYTLLATATGLTAGTSATFNITALPPGRRNWIAAAGGDWNVGSNWSGGTVPGPADTAAIDLAGDYAVTITTPVTVAKVILGGATGTQTLAAVGGTGTLTATDSVHVAASGLLVVGTAGGGPVLSGGPVLVEGAMEWLDGTIAGASELFLTPGSVLLITGTTTKTLSQRSLQNFGQIFFNSTGDLALSDGATIDNLVEGAFDIQTDADLLQGSGAVGAVSNNGFFRKLFGASGVTTIGVAVTNLALMEVQDGTLAFAGPTLTNGTTGAMRGIGTFDVAGTTFSNAGTLGAGLSPGQLGLTGSLTQQATSILEVELGGTQVGTEYDRINVSGAVAVAGTLDLTLINGYQPTVGDSLTILTYLSRSGAGTFAAVNGMDIGGGLRLDTVFTATGLSIVVRSVGAGTISWTNPAGGNWSTGSNWSTGVAPGGTDDVVIDLPGTYTVTLDVSPTVNSLTLGASSGQQTLTGTSRTLTVNGATNIGGNGVLTLTSSTVAGTGAVTNQGTMSLVGSVFGAGVGLTNQGLTTVGGASSLNGPVSALAGGTLRMEGNGTGGTGALTVANGFTNDGVIELASVSGFSSSLTVTAGTLTNSATGVINILTGGGSRTLTAQLDNQGALNLSQALTISKTDAAHVNSGTIDLTAANLTVTQTGTGPIFTHTGAITLGASRTWTVTGGTLDIMAGTITGPTTATLVVSGATLAFNPAALPVPLTATTTTIAGGSVTIPTGVTLTLLNGGLSDPVTMSGGVLQVWGAVSLTGALTMPAGATLRMEGNGTGGTGALTVANGFTNDGTIELASVSGFSSSLMVTAGTLTNSAAGAINILTGGGSRTITAQLDNQGTVTLAQALTLTKADAAHLNGGTLDLTVANLTVTQTGTTPSFTHTGTVTLGANRTWTVTGGTLDVMAGTVSGPTTATLVVTGATLAFDPATLPVPLTAMTTTISGGNVAIPNGSTLTLLNGGLSDPVTIEGVLQVWGGVALNGALSLPAGGTLRMEGNGTGGTGALTVANGFTNDGAIELASVSGFSSSLTVTNGTLTNSATGVINVLTGGGSRTLAVQLDNQGLVNVDQALTLTRASSNHTNSGTLNLSGANLTLTQSGTTPTFTNTGVINVTASRTFTATGGTVTNANAPTVGVIQGAGTLNVNGTTFSNAGDVRPGNALTAGTLSVTGDYPQTVSGVLNVELGGTTFPGQYDRLAASGAATFAGTLNVTTISGFPPAIGNAFTLMTYGSQTGAFATTNLPSLPVGQWQVSVGATTLVLTVIP